MKILFLDIDGCVDDTTRKERVGGSLIIGTDSNKVALIKRIVEETGCKLVLSSSWRHSPALIEYLEEKLGKFYGMTPRSSDTTSIRGDEIDRYLAQNPADIYAIVDDSSDFHADQPLFSTNWEIGLTPEIADQIIGYLNDKITINFHQGMCEHIGHYDTEEIDGQYRAWCSHCEATVAPQSHDMDIVDK
jgi:hypothetical protein